MNVNRGGKNRQVPDVQVARHRFCVQAVRHGFCVQTVRHGFCVQAVRHGFCVQTAHAQPGGFGTGLALRNLGKV